MDQKVKGDAARNAENKRRFNSNSRDNRVQQPPFKRQGGNGQNVARAYTVENSERRRYVGPLPYYNRALVATTTQGAPESNPKVVTCYECGRQGHYRSDFLKLKNQNRGNKSGNKPNKARGRAYALRGGGANPDSNVVTSMFLLNNHHARMLFDLGANRSFVSTTFSVLLDIVPSTLDESENFVVYCDASHKGLGAFFVVEEVIAYIISANLQNSLRKITTETDWSYGAELFSHPEDLRHYYVRHQVHSVHDHEEFTS
ncbi:hypothetical protein Tco_0353418 [Tanacetum coccineum]